MRTLYRLTARKVATLKAPGRYADGGCLYLQIGNGGKSWILRYRQRGTGRVREMGLGSVQTISLQDARQRAATANQQIAAGSDPLADRQAKRAVARKTMTFGVFAKQFLESVTAGFKNSKHKAQWTATLETYAKPIWSMPLPDISTDDVRRILEPIWHTKSETARRVRGRLERVLAAAKASGLRDGGNPAEFKNNLEPFLGKQRAEKQHHSALPFAELPAFMRDLRALKSTSARALEFAILCASRTGEVRGMFWQEIDFENRLWVIPGERMKMKKPHSVPLSERALEILKGLKQGKSGDLVFPGAKAGEPLSDAALLMCLRGLRAGVTTHGFRSSFKDWCADETSFSNWLSELALSHSIKDKTERAYRRSDALEKRREMMQQWGSFLAG